MSRSTHHAADDRQLLVVLLAEHRHVRPHDVEQLADDGRDANEVPGAARPAGRCCSSRTSTVRLEPGGYMSPALGHEGDIDARRGRLGQVALAGRAGSGRDPRLGPNWVGLTKIDSTTRSARRRASSSSATWPACRSPMVGTKAIRSPRARAASDQAVISAGVRTITRRRRVGSSRCAQSNDSASGEAARAHVGGVGGEGVAAASRPARRSGARSAASSSDPARADRASPAPVRRSRRRRRCRWWGRGPPR